jgi:protein involved in polysaccharide export with SLBB domain
MSCISRAGPRMLIALVSSMLGLGLAACISAPSTASSPSALDVPTSIVPVAQAGGSGSVVYTVQPGDELDIKVPDAPQYDQTVKVRPDGKVSMSVVGSVFVQGRTPEDVQTELRERYQQASGGQTNREYLLHANDELDVKFPYSPNFNEQVRIRPDGKIQLQLVGTVQAEGISAEALQAELKRRYAKVLRVPELSVIVRSATSQAVRTDRGLGRAGLTGLEPTVLVRSFQAPQIYVAGEVAKPGMFAFTPGMSLLQAMAQAGGHLPTGDVAHLVVLRRTASGSAQLIEPHLSARYLALPDKDLALQPYDVVLMPPTRVAQLGQDLDQYIFKLLPPLRNSSFGFVYNLNKQNN